MVGDQKHRTLSGEVLHALYLDRPVVDSKGEAKEPFDHGPEPWPRGHSDAISWLGVCELSCEGSGSLF